MVVAGCLVTLVSVVVVFVVDLVNVLVVVVLVDVAVVVCVLVPLCTTESMMVAIVFRTPNAGLEVGIAVSFCRVFVLVVSAVAVVDKVSVVCHAASIWFLCCCCG
jgi:hypothetical protein